MEYQLSGAELADLVAGGIGIVVLGFFMLLMLVLTIVIWWKIFSKAGYSGAMALLMLIPIVNFIMMLVLAFGKWPIHRELEYLKQAQGSPPPAPRP